MNEWMKALTEALMLPESVDARTVLDVARDVAHTVERPAAPVTTYLVGVAVGSGMAQKDAVDRVQALLATWGQPDA